MRSGHRPQPTALELASASRSVGRSRAALAGFLVAVERLGESLAASTESLERREAVLAADEAAGLLSLAADALRHGLARLAALEDRDLSDGLLNIASAAQAGRSP